MSLGGFVLNKEREVRMRASFGPAVSAGIIISGGLAIVETLWLMSARNLSFGVFDEWLLLLESFGVYLLVGAFLGAAGSTLMVLKGPHRHPTNGSEIFLRTCAGIFSLLMFGALTTHAFRKLLPPDIGIGELLGILTVIGIMAISAAFFFFIRWGLLRLLLGPLDRWLGKRIFRVMLPAVIVIFMLVLVGFQHSRTSWKREALDFISPPQANALATMPNVILITMDTVRSSNLQLYGYPRETVPNLTRLAPTSIVYDKATTHSAWTLPSHQTIFTGRYPSELSASWGCKELQDDHLTLAEILKKRGYHTGAVVGGPFCTRWHGLSQGFDYYEDHLPRSMPFLSQLVNRLIPNLFSSVGKRRADQINDFVFRWLEKNSDSPFFLFINYFDAHLRLNPPYPYRLTFEGAFNPIRGFFLSQGDMEFDVTQGKRKLSEAEEKHWVTLYDGEIRFMDSELGRLFDKLKELGVYENTMLVITSDHGHSYGEHNLAGHSGWIFEEVMRVPLIIRYPGGKPGGTRMKERFGLVNLFSLILNELDIPVPTTAHSYEPDNGMEPFILENGREHPLWRLDYPYAGKNLRAIYQGQYKLVTVEGKAAELYDLIKDPEESINLLDRESAVAQRLDHKLSETLKTLLLPPEESGRVLDDELVEELKAVGYL